jgi:hypothetical protein
VKGHSSPAGGRDAAFNAGAIKPPGMPFFHMRGAEYVYFNALFHFK